ncbi:MAG: ankyrin repeat domain-containing protein, partial [Planctomycetaceae bacterium]|nr:ankyrin repeat domain-containing protein [Planctomycetaceae bacterium]
MKRTLLNCSQFQLRLRLQSSANLSDGRFLSLYRVEIFSNVFVFVLMFFLFSFAALFAQETQPEKKTIPKQHNEATQKLLSNTNLSAAQLKDLIKNGADVKATNDAGQTALHIFANTRNYDAVKYLADQGADVNAKDNNGETPLHVASTANFNTTNIIKYLLDKKADINAKNNDNQTPLIKVLQKKYDRKETTTLVKLFIKNGAKTGIKDKNNLTVFNMLVRRNIEIDPNFLKILIEQGNDINWSGDQYSPVACWAAKNGADLKTLEYLKKTKADFNKSNLYGETPFYLFLTRSIPAVKGEISLEHVKLLIEGGADINVPSEPLLQTPLLTVLSQDKPKLETVRYLVEKGADIHIKDKRDTGVLHAAILRKDIKLAEKENYEREVLDIIKYLVEKGADINSPDKIEGARPIHLAAIMGSYKLVKYFEDQKIPLNIKSIKSGETPLHYAVKGLAKIDLVKYLVENGCSINEKNNYKLTPLILATRNTYADIDVIKYLCDDKNLEINIGDQLGSTPLILACHCSKNPAIIKHLIECGADVKAVSTKGKGGISSLHALMYNGGYSQNYVLQKNIPQMKIDAKEMCDLITLLVDKGADINCKNDRGATPLLDAMSFHAVDTSVLAFLVQKGADVNVRDSNGRSCGLIFIRSSRKEAEAKELMKILKIDVNNPHYKTLMHEALKEGARLNVLNLHKYGGFPINTRDQFGSTLLHVAVTKNDNKIIDELLVRNLIRAGADVNVKDNNGATPLHDAAERGRPEMLTILLEAGADVNAKDIHGMTPLDIV